MLKGVNRRKIIKLVHTCVNALGTPLDFPDRPGIFWSRYGISVTILGVEGIRAFNELVRYLIDKGLVADTPLDRIYAEETVKKKVRSLISQVVNQHGRFATRDQIAVIYDEWIHEFDAEFPTSKYHVVMTNLRLDHPLRIGRVTFKPLTHETCQDILQAFSSVVNKTRDSQEKKSKLEEHAATILNTTSNDALAEIELEVDRTLGYELCLAHTQRALNVLRFYGYFLYPRALRPYVGIRGQLQRGRLQAITIATSLTTAGIHSKATGPLAVYDISGDNRQTLERLHIRYVSDLLSAYDDGNLHEAQECLVSAIEWAGRAAQSVEPEARYLNLWIAIETLLTCDDDKTRQESQGQLIALRASLLLPMKDDQARIRVQNLWSDKLYQVRNDLVHRGGSADLDEFLPKLEFYAPVVILRCIEELSRGQTWSSKARFLDRVESQGTAS